MPITEYAKLVELGRSKAAELLDVTPEKVLIFNRTIAIRNKVIKDIEWDFPIVTTLRRHHENCSQRIYGLSLCETKNGSRYVYGYTRTYSASFGYLFVRSGDAFRVIREILRTKNKAVVPILPDKLIHSIRKDVIGFLRSHKQLRRLGVKAARGLMFHGTPGNGKSMVCRWLKSICTDFNIVSKTVSASQIIESFNKDTLKDLLAAQLVFFDDIDISFLSRKGPKADISCALLAALDGLDESEFSVRIFTSNEDVSEMDPAFLRPGRIDKIFHFPKPNESLRLRFAETWDPSITKAISAQSIAENTDQFSFAEMESLRSILVVNNVCDKRPYDLDDALREYHEQRSSGGAAKRPVGFVA